MYARSLSIHVQHPSCSIHNQNYHGTPTGLFVRVSSHREMVAALFLQSLPSRLPSISLIASLTFPLTHHPSSSKRNPLYSMNHDISPRYTRKCLLIPHIRRPKAHSLSTLKTAFLLSFLLFDTVTSCSPSISRIILVASIHAQSKILRSPALRIGDDGAAWRSRLLASGLVLTSLAWF